MFTASTSHSSASDTPSLVAALIRFTAYVRQYITQSPLTSRGTHKRSFTRRNPPVIWLRRRAEALLDFRWSRGTLGVPPICQHKQRSAPAVWGRQNKSVDFLVEADPALLLVAAVDHEQDAVAIFAHGLYVFGERFRFGQADGEGGDGEEGEGKCFEVETEDGDRGRDARGTRGLG